MTKIRTKSGFEIDIDNNVLNNMELLDAFAALSDSDFSQMSRIIPMILGKEGRKKLYDHLRLPDGRVPADAVDRELGEIVDALSGGKNSSSSPN